MRRVAVTAYLIALLTGGIGVLLSIQLQEWSWFSRSGALIVVNGILLTSNQIIQHIHSLNLQQRHPRMLSGRDFAQLDKQQFLHEDRELTWRSEKYGLYMLITGTLIWGFGDLLGIIVG